MYGLVTATLLAASLVAPAEAEIYKWVAPDGTVSFSERPPPGVRSEQVTVRTGKQDAATIARQQALLEAERAQVQEQQESAQQAAVAQEKARIRADNCKRARANLAQLESAIRIYETNNQGVREKVGEEQRAANIERMQKVVTENCK
ncbi:MAG: DUF4124 domain-containing protein [Gammaproteobacteria bacterium]|nr:DUF4124 domain-containing protein [Gammaproteobacteria bacterium]